jgi:hypothetical protein
MTDYESCLCDQETVTVETIGNSVTVTRTCVNCGNKVYDTNYTLDDLN